MEWVLQVMDEFDDAVGALRHACMGVAAAVDSLWGGTPRAPDGRRWARS